jgi:hypothetical protein
MNFDIINWKINHRRVFAWAEYMIEKNKCPGIVSIIRCERNSYEGAKTAQA